LKPFITPVMRGSLVFSLERNMKSRSVASTAMAMGLTDLSLERNHQGMHWIFQQFIRFFQYEKLEMKSIHQQ
jgi:hypothetical protein